MIIYDLLCSCGCQFEGWFNDQLQYLEQKEKNMLACPACGGGKVHKILSPVAVHLTGYGEQHCSPPQTPADKASERQAASRLLQALQGFVRENFEDVGAKLAEESLKIHFGVEQPRNIRGVATWEEEKMLRDEGVELLKIPFPEDDKEVH